MAIAFRDSVSHENTANSADCAVTIPGTIQSNDGLLAVYAVAGTNATITTPAGWTLINTIDKGTVIRAAAFKKVAAGADAGSTLTVSKSAADATKKYLAVLAYSGTDTTDFIDAFQLAVETVAGNTHTSPNVTTSGSTDWIVETFMDRGSPASTDITPPTGFTERAQQVGTGSGTLTIEVCDSNGTVSSGVHGGDTASGTVSTANVVMMTFALKAAGGTSATATPATVTGAVSIGTPTVLNGANVTVHPVTVVGRAVFVPLVGQASSTMFPDKVSGVATIPSPTESAQQFALVIPELVVVGAVSIGLPTIVAENNGGVGGGTNPPPSGTRTFVGPFRFETWPLAPNERLAVKVKVNQTLYRQDGVWLIGENLSSVDFTRVDRLYTGGYELNLSDEQLDELVAAGQGQYVVDIGA